MKNAIIIDIDTDREQPIMLGKPPEIAQPQNAEEASAMIKDDISCVCEALCTLILMANNSGYASKEELVNASVYYLNSLLAPQVEQEPSVEGTAPQTETPQENA